MCRDVMVYSQTTNSSSQLVLAPGLMDPKKSLSLMGPSPYRAGWETVHSAYWCFFYGLMKNDSLHDLAHRVNALLFSPFLLHEGQVLIYLSVKETSVYVVYPGWHHLLLVCISVQSGPGQLRTQSSINTRISHSVFSPCWIFDLLFCTLSFMSIYLSIQWP